MLPLDVRQVLLVLLSSLLFSCDWGVEWRDKPYEVVWINIGENRMLNYEIAEGSSIGRVEAEIIAVGSNEKYVVAKQRSIDDGSISYYYIDRGKDNKYLDADEIAQGPFSETRFRQLRSDLGLPEFSKVF